MVRWREVADEHIARHALGDGGQSSFLMRGHADRSGREKGETQARGRSRRAPIPACLRIQKAQVPTTETIATSGPEPEGWHTLNEYEKYSSRSIIHMVMTTKCDRASRRCESETLGLREVSLVQRPD